MNKWILYMTFAFLLTNTSFAESYTPIDDLSQVSILTPCLSSRETAKLKLENGMEVYLISDKEASKAGAVLTVQAGSWNDPADAPGLAHFLEHMLFLGTEKYPIESDYSRFVREHDGKTNAYTTSDHTLYLFSISPSAFTEALDRFSHFFKNPLFNPSGVGRELQAVDQEFSKNLDQDTIRELYVTKELANPNHPFHRFSAGNITTLSHVSQSQLKAWYQEHYSSNHMKLIVYSPAPLSELKELVLNNFSSIAKTNLSNPYPSPEISPFDTATKEKIVWIKPIKNSRILRLSWVISLSSIHSDEFKAENLVASVLGHEGEGSLFAKLKEDDLAEALSAGGYRLGKHHLIFSITIHLTEEGLTEYSQVIQRCFEAIALLKSSQFPPYLAEEVKNTQLYCYQYQSREDVFDYLMTLGGLLVHEKLDKFPENCLICSSFDHQALTTLIQGLTPQDVRITLIASNSRLIYDHKEKWMGIPYFIEPVTKKQLDSWTNLPLNKALHLPKPNLFIPIERSLIESHPPYEHSTDQKLPKVTLLIDQEKVKIYHAFDHRFLIPKAQWSIDIKTPMVNSGNSKFTVLSHLYSKAIDDALNQYAYPARLADLSYGVSAFSNGISINLSGYYENTATLFEMILEKLKTCTLSESKFQIFKESLLRKYSNFKEESSLKHASETYQSILFEYYSTANQLKEALEPLTAEDFNDYLKHLFDYTYTEGIFYGNITQLQSKNLVEQLEKTLDSKLYKAEERLIERVVVLPENKGPFAVDISTDSQSHAVILSIEAADFSFKNRAAQQILAQAIHNPFYTALRTKQQTGYLVFSKAEEIDKHLFLYFAVQSATHDPRDLLARFELFIESFLQELENEHVTKETFERSKAALLHTMENSPDNFEETVALLKSLAFDYDADFDWMNKRIQGFKDLSYEEFITFTKQFLGKSNRRRLAVLAKSALTQDGMYTIVDNGNEVRLLSHYEGVKL